MTKVKQKKSENEMWKDPIVAELHDVREAYAKKFKYDLDAMFEDFKSYEKALKEKGVGRSPRKKPA